MADIVIIEDSRPIVFLIEAILEAHYRVQSYGDGEQGLAALRRSPPDLVILDIGLPDISGFEVATQMRRDISLADKPILMLTALSDTDSRVRGLQIADDYLTKPFDKRELLARVNGLLRRKENVGGVRGRLELIGGAGAAVQIVALVHPRGALIFDDGVVVYFDQGRIIHVQSPAGVPTDAAFIVEIFDRSSGGVRFEPSATLPPATLDLDPMGILLEAARVRDETARDVAAASTVIEKIDIDVRNVTVLPNFDIAQMYLERLKSSQTFRLQQMRDAQKGTLCVAIVGQVLTLVVPDKHLDEVPTSLRNSLSSAV
jgi:CheY-like chemotaxis protein